MRNLTVRNMGPDAAAMEAAVSSAASPHPACPTHTVFSREASRTD